MMTKPNKSLTALLSRGFSSDLAQDLVKKRYTFNKLKQLDDTYLRNLGIPEHLFQRIHSERPPIPEDTIVKLLYDARWTCCVCRQAGSPIVIHHLVAWAKSKNHSIDNLVVLCPNDHARAHRTGSLEKDLSPSLLRQTKEKWIEENKNHEALFILSNAAESSYATWNYFNHQRIFELAFRKGGAKKTAPYYRELRRNNILNDAGVINDTSLWNLSYKPKYYLYDTGEGIKLYTYMSSIWEGVLSALPVVELSDKWTLAQIDALIIPGSFIACTGAHYFKSGKIWEGRNQIRTGYRKNAGILIEYQFDAWESTSSSSKNYHLSGRRVVTSICVVRSLDKNGENLALRCSVLSIGSYLYLGI